MSGAGISRIADDPTDWVWTTGAFTTGAVETLDEDTGMLGAGMFRIAEDPKEDVWKTGVFTTGAVDTLDEDAGMLGACTVKMAFGLEKDWLGLEKDCPITRGARGACGLRKEGTRNPLNGFLNLNWAFVMPIKATKKINDNFIFIHLLIQKQNK